MRKSAVPIRTAAQKNFHKIFTFEQTRRFFQVLVGALLISDYARARFFVQRNRVTFSEADWISGDRRRSIAANDFAVELQESPVLKSCVRHNSIR
jgi:hypothetical protein